MDKRTFLKNLGWIGAGIAGSGVIWSACSVQNGKTTGENWLWSQLQKDLSDKELTAKFHHWSKMGITGVFFGGADERVYQLAKAQGLATHLWMWTLNRGEEFIREHHPEWYSVNRIGESCLDHPPYVDYYRWLCPSREEVQDYLSEQVNESLQLAYVDGIHLDYVRYCDVILPKALWEKYDLVQHEELPQFDYCYCEVCREKFEAQSGMDPLAMDNPPGNQAWLQYRYDTVTNLVNRLSKEVRSTGKLISAAVFPSPTIAKKLVRQEWNHWNLDMIFPMVYHSFYEEDLEWIGNVVQEGRSAIPEQQKYFAGLYLPAFEEPSELSQAIALAIDKGANGVSLFGKLEQEDWAAFQQAIAIGKTTGS